MSPSKSDVLIIGGGVIGACSALYLTRRGIQVTLLEKNQLCAGASHGNACWIALSHAIPTAAPGVLGQGLRWMLDPGSPFYIKPRLNFDLVRWLWAFSKAATTEKMKAGTQINLDLNRRSMALFKALDAEGLDFDFAQQGFLHLHLSEKKRRAGKEELHFLAQFGVEGHVLDRSGLETIQSNLGPDVQSGIYYPDPGHLRPDKLVRAVAGQAEQEGATILTQTAVTGFETKNNRITAVHTPQGSHHAAEVVLAAGAWSSLLAKQLGIHLLMQPAKGYSVTAKRPAPHLGPQLPLAVDDYKLAITPLGDDFRFSSTLELAGFDLSINQRRLAANNEGLKRALLGLGELEIKETWSGFRPLSADGLPIIGRSEKIKNLILATGHGTLGITQGPVTGELVAEIVSNSPENS